MEANLFFPLSAILTSRNNQYSSDPFDDLLTMRIAFQTFTRALWMAGMVTFQDLLIALHTLNPDRPRLEMVQWKGTVDADYAMLRPYVDGALNLVFPPPPKPEPNPPRRSKIESSYTRAARARLRLARILVPPPPPARPKPREETLKRLGIDCVFSVTLEHRTDLSAPLLVWIYDLQHHHMPEFLEADQRAQRDQIIAKEAGRAERLIVQSKSVGDDLNAFVPEHRNKVRVLPWVSNVPARVYEMDPTAVLRRYNLPEKFIYLPNQFWKHKNHLLVIHALESLQQRNIYPVVVSTGSIWDHRNPEYIGELMRELARTRLHTQFIMLGSVPRDDVFALMRQAISVLNPSLFEGYGLSASEATSLGKRTLLADLPSLREQNPPDAVYFNPNDKRELATCMEEVWETSAPGPDLEREAAACAALPTRQNGFARAFLDIATEAIQTFRAAQ